MNRSSILLKFGQAAHLEDFRNGNLYMNSRRYFTRVEGDMLRHDPYEGADEIHQPKDIVSLKIKDNNTGKEIVLKSDNFVSPLILNFGRQSFNLFCMHSISSVPETGGSLVDERNLHFGDSFIVTLHNQEFLNRVQAAATKMGLDAAWDLVEYLDTEKHSGAMGPFRKAETFSYQREFRIVVFPGSEEAIRLSVGSLFDITTPIFPLSDINKSMKVHQPE